MNTAINIYTKGWVGVGTPSFLLEFAPVPRLALHILRLRMDFLIYNILP